MFAISLTLEDGHLTGTSTDGLTWHVSIMDRSDIPIEADAPRSVCLPALPGDELAAIVSLAMHPEGAFDEGGEPSATTLKLYELAERSQRDLPRNLRFIP